MYALIDMGIQIGTYATLQACQAVATGMQYCMYVGG